MLDALRRELDDTVERLAIGETAWSTASVAERCDLLAEVADAAALHAPQWVRIAAQIKQLDPADALVGEEWISGPYAVIGFVRALQETLAHLANGTDVLSGYRIAEAPGNRLAVHVMPHQIFDKLLLNGFRAEIWTTPGTTQSSLRDGAGLAQRFPTHTKGVALVLGAGNIFSIPLLDVLYQLYAHNRTVVLKLNPVTDPLFEVFRVVLKPMIDRNLVELLTGDAGVGSVLANHQGVAAVHMTGSEATHDAIVWGAGAAGASAKRTGMPQLDKPISSELGGVCPIIVLPGTWSGADLRYQAEHVATQRLHNSGCNCVAGQIVIISSDWPQKDAFLAEVRRALANAPPRPAWYPGCEARTEAARHMHPGAESTGGSPERTLLTGLDLTNGSETAFTTEYFAPVLGVAEIPGLGIDFLSGAVAAANDRLRGTLGANLIVHPRTARDLGDHLRDAVGTLRYGTIGVNAWTGLGFLTPRATWGAYPCHTLEDVQSGIGVVHNALLLDHVERTVLTGPFRPFPRSLLHGELSISPKPPWFVSNRTAAITGRRLTDFTARPRWSALPALFASALRG